MNRVSNKPCAIVLGLDHVNGLQPARALAKRDIPVIGIAKHPSHYCSRTNVCNRIIFTDTKSESLISTLEELGPTLDQQAVLFPCTDIQVLLVSRFRDRLESWYHILLPPHEVVETLMVKTQFYSFAKEHNLPIPRTILLRNFEDVERVGQELRFPCILKPPLSANPDWERKSRLKAYLLSSKEELISAYRRFSHLADSLIVQEWIVGPITNLYSCNCYFNRDSEPISTFVTHKLRQWPPDTGEGCLGEACHNRTLVEETIRLFKTVDFVGLGYLEMKRDERTGKYLIVEPNVGRPTGRSVTAEAGGVELLYTMYCDALGWPLPENLEQKNGTVKWIYFRRDLQSAFYHWRRGELSPIEWLMSLRGVKVDALFSWGDQRPFWGDIARAIRLYLSPEERRKRDYTTPLG